MSNYLKGNLSVTKEEKPIIEELLESKNLTTGNKNLIAKNEKEVVLEFANENFENDIMYFVRDSKKVHWRNNKREFDDSKFAVLKVENGKIEEIGIDKKDMPSNIGINSVFSSEKGKYILKAVDTEELREKLTNMVEHVVDEQNISLEDHRKEGHLYLVTEEVGNNRFLWDLTDRPKKEFEEVDIPKELLNQAVEGIVLKYNNGSYEFFSDDGFDRIYET